ncbi:MAG TPA: hypothetical protein VGR47_09800 [Terracidiphilus sp.]|nr:hypothetical protein [Terracidiphilus sp.]
MRLRLPLACLLIFDCAALAAAQVTIDHRWSNTDAQSLIGLPMGSHKTIIDKQGNLKWSQWSLKRRPFASNIGFSAQMDGEIAIQPFADDRALTVDSQKLYRGRYPFVVTSLHNGDLAMEELAFAADPDARPGVLPNASSGARGMDVVRFTFHNSGATAAEAQFKLSGRERNLPGHVTGHNLITRAGEDVALVTEAAGAAVRSEANGLELNLHVTVPAHGEKTLWIEEPYEYLAARNTELSHESGEALLAKAVAQWDGLWSHAMRIDFPQRQLSDFYYSSIAYVLILTEYDRRGDLWTLDGPAVYRQYWGRGEYFQSRALEVAGFLSPARQSVEHAFHLISDDGEWDFPPVSGWPAWDNMGGNAGAVWQYYLYSGDKQWLARAYPDLLRTSEWIRDHREESSLESVSGIPVGAEPIRRMIPSRCRNEPDPPLAPGEKPFWFGLLPWSYGDSGIPQGHSFAHNFMAAYAVHVTADAAKVLGHASDEAWLGREYANYTAAIREDVNRAVGLEKTTPVYLPAMPTYPEAAYSQTFLAVYPTQIYSPEDPLVTGLLDRMESGEKQGLPTNVAWAGPAGVWAGEAMNMAETYLLRGEKQKAVDMLVAALNHSYTTKVWKEEILVDPDLPRACEGPHSKRKAMQGTGDMPEAWANANLVLFLRDMLLNEREDKLHLLAGLLPDWVPEGKSLELTNAPVTTGGEVSLRVEHAGAKLWRITVDPHDASREFVLHLPMDPSTVASVRIGGKPASIDAAIPFTAPGKVTTIEVTQK